jgi:hypothetical protein
MDTDDVEKTNILSFLLRFIKNQSDQRLMEVMAGKRLMTLSVNAEGGIFSSNLLI